MPNTSHATRLLLVAALVLHALTVLSHWKTAHREQHGRDFASYYYAVDVALEGGDPYTRGSLGDAAREDGTRRGVHPFFYPPPYILTMLWVAPLDLVTAYRAWFWLDELLTLLAFLVLWRWWRPLSPLTAPALALFLAGLTAIPNNHLMGQMNAPVLLLALVGLRDAERGRWLRGGAAMGLACMLKMSPAFLVMWWLLRGRWKAAVASVGAAVLLTLASLPVVGAEVQWAFYTDVLPGFASGRYNGLGVGIDIFGNHSVANLWDQLFPEGPAHLVLSGVAGTLSTLTTLTVVGSTAWMFRRAPADELARAGQIGAVTVAMLLVPVFTYEHHLVWALPAALAAVLGVASGRLGSAWVGPVGFAVALWCYDLASLKEMSLYVRGDWPLLAFALQEAKFVALLVLYAAGVRLGTGRDA